MKKPEQPFKSGNYIRFHETSDHPFISKFYLHPDSNEEDFLHYHFDEPIDEEFKPKIEEWWYDTDVMSVQDILENLPHDADLKDVFISIHRERQIEYVEVRVSHRTPNNKEIWQAGHDAEEEDYEHKLSIYEKELAEYEILEKEQKMKELQDEINKLKK